MTDASDTGASVVVAQASVAGGRLKPLWVVAKSFDDTMRNWSTSEQEMFALKLFVEKLHHHVANLPLMVMCDHKNLGSEELENTLVSGRASAKLLRQYWQCRHVLRGSEVYRVYLTGPSNTAADFFSRTLSGKETKLGENNDMHLVRKLMLECFVGPRDLSRTASIDVSGKDFAVKFVNALEDAEKEEPLADQIEHYNTVQFGRSVATASAPKWVDGKPSWTDVQDEDSENPFKVGTMKECTNDTKTASTKKQQNLTGDSWRVTQEQGQVILERVHRVPRNTFYNPLKDIGDVA